MSHFFLWVLGYSDIIRKPDSNMILIQHHEKLTQGEIGPYTICLLCAKCENTLSLNNELNMDQIKSKMTECVIKEEIVLHFCFLRYKGQYKVKEKIWFMVGLLFIFINIL